MGTLVSDGDFWVIRGHMSDKVKQEFDGMVEAHHVIMNYIIDSAKQMADFVQRYGSVPVTICIFIVHIVICHVILCLNLN